MTTCFAEALAGYRQLADIPRLPERNSGVPSGRCGRVPPCAPGGRPRLLLDGPVRPFSSLDAASGSARASSTRRSTSASGRSSSRTVRVGQPLGRLLLPYSNPDMLVDAVERGGSGAHPFSAVSPLRRPLGQMAYSKSDTALLNLERRRSRSFERSA
jgi:hypothetical protein